MNEYFALIIPVIFGIILILFFNKRVTWWEMILPTIVGLITIFGMKSCDQKININDTEYLSQYVTKAVYEEPWNEWITKTCSERYACGTEVYSTGTGKNRHMSTRTKYCTRYYDCSYCKNHAALWYIINSEGTTYSITQTEYNNLVKTWNNQKFIDMKRNYYTLNGNKYETCWNNDKKTLITTHSSQSYENRIQASHSIYNYLDINDSDKVHNEIYEYPDIKGYKQNSILSKHYVITENEQNYINTINGLLGKKKEVQYYVLIWKNKPYSVSEYQKSYWKGGNKNEIIVCIGLDKNNNIQWTNVFTWAVSDIVRIKIRDYILSNTGKKLNIYELSDISYDIIDKKWKRKNFHDFDFLEIELTETQISWIYIIVIILSLGLSIFAILNKVDPKYQQNTKDQYIYEYIKNKINILMYKLKNNYRKLKKYVKK